MRFGVRYRRAGTAFLFVAATLSMKTKTQILALLLATVLVAGAIVYAERTRPREITLPVKGMVCDGCEEHLREKLLEAQGVQAAVPSHKDGQVTIVVAGWSRAEEAELREIIKRAGYEPVESE
jgi:Cu2+-exporting ATPase